MQDMCMNVSVRKKKGNPRAKQAVFDNENLHYDFHKSLTGCRNIRSRIAFLTASLYHECPSRVGLLNRLSCYAFGYHVIEPVAANMIGYSPGRVSCLSIESNATALGRTPYGRLVRMARTRYHSSAHVNIFIRFSQNIHSI